MSLGGVCGACGMGNEFSHMKDGWAAGWDSTTNGREIASEAGKV